MARVTHKGDYSCHAEPVDGEIWPSFIHPAEVLNGLLLLLFKPVLAIDIQSPSCTLIWIRPADVGREPRQPVVSP